MAMFSPPYTYYNNPSSKYELIGGAYYVPGTAAYNKAKQLAPIYSQPVVTPTAAAASIIAPYAPKATAPTSFPSYSAGGMGGGSVLPGAPGRTGQGAFGLVPQVPNPVTTAGAGITGNIANLGNLGNLGTQTTKLAGNLAAMPFQQNLPGYEGMIAQSSQNILSNLKGIIDPSTWEELQRKMAERGTSVGITPASPNFDTALMQALAEKITAEQKLGQEQLNAAIGRTPTGQPFNIAGQQITPGTMQEAQWGANVAGAAPDPTMAAQANLDMLLRAIEAGRAGGMGGMGGYGGGGGMPRLSQPVLSPVSSGYKGFYMPNYPTAPGGWSGKVEQPFYRTSEPGPSGVPSDIVELANQLGSGYGITYDPLEEGSGYGVTYDPLEDYSQDYPPEYGYWPGPY